jgi:diacylglycerol kinase (ATP)
LRPKLLATQAAGDATDLARQALAGGADLVLVLGGDGTINEAVNALAHSPVPLGLLPGGTANVLAMELGLGSKPETAAGRLAGCVPRRIALGRVTLERGDSRYFLSMGGIGLDADIVTKVNPVLKAKTGKAAYWVAGLGHFLQSVGQFEACTNGTAKRYGFVLASRVRNYGGDLEIASGASLLRNDFEAVSFEGSNPFRYAAYMLAVGFRKVQAMPGVHTARVSSLQVFSPAPVQVDGEFIGMAPARFEIIPDALTLLMPEDYR